MKSEFTTWYSTSFPQDALFIDKRWEAISGYAEDLTKNDLALLAQLAFRLKPSMSSAEVAKLRQDFSGQAATVGDEELYMLSACALEIAIRSNNNGTAALAASIVTSASCSGLRELKQPMDLVGSSNNVLRQLSETLRRRPALTQAKLVTPTLDKEDPTLQKALTEESGEISNVVNAMISLTNKAISKIASRQREFEAAVNKYVSIQDEELDILWWLEGEHSFDLDQDFLKIEEQHLPLTVARELAGLTKVLPGPPALSSIFSRTRLQDSSQLPIVEWVQSMPVAWLQSTIDHLVCDNVSPALTPILFALQRRNEVDGNDDWIQAWCTTTGLSRESSLSPLQLAVAAYREFSWTQLN